MPPHIFKVFQVRFSNPLAPTKHRSALDSRQPLSSSPDFFIGKFPRGSSTFLQNSLSSSSVYRQNQRTARGTEVRYVGYEVGQRLCEYRPKTPSGLVMLLRAYLITQLCAHRMASDCDAIQNRFPGPKV